MGRGILILKKATKYASSKMLMDINGKDQVGIFKFIMFYKIDEDQGFSFLRNRGVTYMTKQQVTLIV
jgi:hypothetical protein